MEPLESLVLLDAGALDPTFGVGGKVLADFGAPFASASSTALQADGKIVVAGSVALGTDFDFLVARYNPDGSPDATFGTGGTVTTDFRQGNDYARGVVLQADGKIVVVGSAQRGPALAFGSDVALARYHTDGSLDPTFGAGGKVITVWAQRISAAEAVTIQPDGRIVVAGSSRSAYEFSHGGFSGEVWSSSSEFTLARYGLDGQLDPAFGSGGTVILPSSGQDDNTASGVAVQPDGKIVMVGTSVFTGDFSILCLSEPCFIRTSSLVLTRLNVNGSPDGSFGQGGMVVDAFNDFNASGSGLALQADGRIVVVGSASTAQGGSAFGLARYNADGSVDTDFGSGGKVTLGFGRGFDQANGVALQADGRIVVVGYSSTRLYSMDADFALARFNADGSLDTDFGVGGRVETDFGGADMATAVALQADGMIVVVGSLRGDALALARYQGS